MQKPGTTLFGAQDEMRELIYSVATNQDGSRQMRPKCNAVLFAHCGRCMQIDELGKHIAIYQMAQADFASLLCKSKRQVAKIRPEYVYAVLNR